MSFQNHLAVKQMRRDIRTARKERAVRLIPFSGVITTKKIVLGHRYLAVNRLPYSASIANVLIGAKP